MGSNTRQKLVTGLKELFLGVILGALCNVGILVGLEGGIFSSLAVASLILYIVALKRLYPLHAGFRRAVWIALLWIFAEVGLIAAEHLLVKIPFLPGIFEIVAFSAKCVAMVVETVLSCVFVFFLCRAVGDLLEEAGDTDNAGLSKQAIYIFWGCAVLSLIFWVLCLLPFLGGRMLQLSGALSIFGYFVLGAFLNRAKQSLEA